ncbi:sensor histidine kinase [Paraburkholderia sp. CNPSo 3155]|uniref:ATP-binding protein n=1 Tax=Paraburkholderia atlantica TaxID=2654982 RepID=UPI00128B4731|nr:ATP-binding protein [Paraburkholderia atlantica]MPW11072.1 sensor histidine kinase [Paraburkholderia atlantica]
MTREQALSKLLSDSSHDRFHAARALMKLARPEDLQPLLKARHAERDSYVLKQIEVAIASCSKRVTVLEMDDDDQDEDESLSRVKADAIEWISGILLHEIGSKLGLIALSASREVPNFVDSKTARHVRNLQSIFDAIEQLRSASIKPSIERFDLAELIDEVASVENEGNVADISLVGMRPLLVTSSRHLLQLALCNGLRNGIEAGVIKRQGGRESAAHLVVTWGKTDREFWVSVVDDGPGLARSAATSFGIGKSTKAGHAGFGLAIAMRALETLGGEVSLSPSPGGGAKYEIRWGITE